MKIGVFTIASKNYLAYARTLMASVKEHLPEYRRYLCLADEVSGEFEPSKEVFEVIQADQIGIDSFQDMTIRYDIMEFNTAVKPFMIEWLFNNTDLDVVIYLDPDIQVFSKFDRLEAVIERGASVVLIPHITRPVEDGFNPNDHTMLQAGVFNLGFIAVRRCDEARQFIRWWGRRLKTQCASDFSRNLFTDQRWCDLAPCFLNNLHVFKDPGYNIAYWNLMQRKVEHTAEGKWLVDSQPLVFFHFSGVSADNRELVSKHQNRFNWNDIELLQPLFKAYLDNLHLAGWKACKNWDYAYSVIKPSLKIATVMRQFYREKHPETVFYEENDISSYLINLCNQPSSINAYGDETIITELMMYIYQIRPDLRAAFSLATQEGRRGFAHWFEISAVRDYGLPQQVMRQLLSCEKEEPPGLKKRIIRMILSLMHLLRKQAVQFGEYLPEVARNKLKYVWRKFELTLFRNL